MFCAGGPDQNLLRRVVGRRSCTEEKVKEMYGWTWSGFYKILCQAVILHFQVHKVLAAQPLA